MQRFFTFWPFVASSRHPPLPEERRLPASWPSRCAPLSAHCPLQRRLQVGAPDHHRQAAGSQRRLHGAAQSAEFLTSLSSVSPRKILRLPASSLFPPKPPAGPCEPARARTHRTLCSFAGKIKFPSFSLVRNLAFQGEEFVGMVTLGLSDLGLCF